MKGKKYLILDNNIFELNEIGEEIWNQINGENTLDEIAKNLSQKFNKELKCILDDVNDFVQELNTNNLVLND